jgi:uncharacterized protein (DUF2126 family)/transglutaminase-like putative cysteine protease
MGIRVALRHETCYTYDRPVTLLPHVVRLRPAPHSRTPILAYSLNVEPSPHFLNWQQDPYSNWNGRLVFPKPGRKFRVVVDLVAEMTPINPFDFFLDEDAQEYPFQYDEVAARELTPYLETLPAGPKLRALIEACRDTSTPRTIDYIVALNQAVQKVVSYIIRMEPGVQTPEETLEKGQGSCRDSAWLLVQLCRHLGIAARFASGYLIQLVADEKPIEGPEGPAADFTDLHAWTEVYLPGAGWVGLDPTSGLLTAEGHIPLACTADPQSAAPITGSYAWAKDDDEDKLGEEFHFEMKVTRVLEMPRVTKPYTPEQWAAIDALGQRVDNELRDWDVRLTMGGEPTFVSIDDRDAPEWNTAALGGRKRPQAAILLKRLRDQFAPQGLLHFGQGKWYPGEQLPRWAFGCYWRRDGQPIWMDPDLIGDEEVAYGFTSADAKRFMTTLTEALDVNPEHIHPCYEDAWYYLWRERRLPTNVDPLDSKLEDPLERARLSKVFEQGLGHTVGYALPLRKGYANGREHWESGPWFYRKEHMFLFPGDSPMGYRLPLDSLAWEPGHLKQFMDPMDPFKPRPALPGYSRPQFQPGSVHGHANGPNGDPNGADWFARMSGLAPGANGRAKPTVAPVPPFRADGYSDPNWYNVVRTALCVEPRDGKMYVFMPPARCLEDYLELVSAIEASAAATGIPVLIEGYKPPYDYRLNHFSITPDPGVIEANMHPAHSWEETVHITETLYEEAKQSRLSSEKFMLDGRHTGTGGGNHIVLGGPTPADSPLLRRPDLLRSLVSFWNNHPSLSYLFSGLFVGPTSQHPRVDEARHDSLYELEIAFKQVNPGGPTPPAWLVDRVFRNLLVDITGNTHRTEFCIDKMYSPDSASGRLGLVELRSFEMPPHAKMSLAQQLLIRAAITRFWKQPYEHKLVRWGTELHDRFMLPHYVWQDFEDVLDEFRQAGYPFDPSWFIPHQEFRFTPLGSVTHRGINLELRTAIEPWHVLGEEAGAGGASRYVDSSLERLQVKVRGLTDPRHVVTCNGRRLPLQPTGTNGEFVAGVRYRAWQPPSCLHPTIPVHTPLVFDVLDTWNDRSIGGCQYHVAHPGGRANETFPVNALAAESRRIARFFSFGHTPGSVSVPPPEPRPEFPYTLDLRQPEPPVASYPTSPTGGYGTNRIAGHMTARV